MKKILPVYALAMSCVCVQNKDYPIQAVNFTDVRLTDQFWQPRIKTNHTVAIPASFRHCESTGRVKNFEMEAKKEGKICRTFLFDPTDIYRTNKGASNAWAGTTSREMSPKLYSSEHLHEAATAHYLATKKRKLLDIALRNVDLVYSVFGPGKRAVDPGHEVVQKSLIKLYRLNGSGNHINAAKFPGERSAPGK